MPRMRTRLRFALLGTTLAATQLAAQDLRPASRPEAVTWSEHIAKIVYAECTTCHRPGEAAPFALTSYEEAKRKAKMMVRVTEKRTMPPWHAEPGHGRFLDERRLDDAEIELLRRWVLAGAPEGDPAKAPPLPHFPQGWQLGEPDLVLEMRDAFEVPASGPDIYRNFVLQLSLEEDRWVSAIEVRPSARNVVHHVLFFLDDTDASRSQDGRDGRPGFSGMARRRAGFASLVGGEGGSLGGWAVGATPRRLPEDLAMHLPKGSDLVLQTHFHPSGKVERERTTIGIHFAKAPPKRTLLPLQLPPFFGLFAGIDLAPGVRDFAIRDSFVLPVASEAVSVGGHAHYLCTEMKATATLPDGAKVPLLWIRHWDFAWQDRYQYAERPRLPAGTRIDVEIHYDNSAENPKNPFSPPRRVRFGRESTDEMGSLTLALVPCDEADAGALRSAIRTHNQRAVRQRLARPAAASRPSAPKREGGGR